VEALPAVDWAARLQKDFPPRRIGRFYVHGSHVRKGAPRGCHAIRIDAGGAFGTGEHESTEGCLVALDRLASRRRGLKEARVLDMGCGSGILAIAAGKLGASVLAVDRDASAVAVARENVRLNGVAARVRLARADGYRGIGAREGRFDLVFANILARPVIRMAPALARRLAPGGRAVLAGFLDRDGPRVAEAHRAVGLTVIGRIRCRGWTTLVVGRAAKRAR
jgi:ribosomal protein L11 methyltransferase